MKLLAIDMSRLTALFTATRISGQVHMPTAIMAISDRYGFVGTPKSLEEMTGDRIALTHGLFKGNAIESFEIYNDGIVITSKSDTDFIDDFFSDLCEWTESEIGITRIKTREVDRLYDSTLLIESDSGILRALDGLSEIGRMIDSNLRDVSNLDTNFVPFGISLSSDQSKNPSLKPAAFRIERHIGTDFELNHFVATAPLQTKQHLSILEKLEAL